MLKYILLGFLNYQPMTGYAVKTLMEGSTSQFWHAYHSQIYTTLRKLEDEGLLSSEPLEQEDSLNRRVYTITDTGRAELEMWLATPLLEPVAVKEDLLVRVFFSAQRDPQLILSELRLQRTHHLQKLTYYLNLTPEQLYTSMLGSLTDEKVLTRETPYWLATLRFGVAYEQMYIAWLDDLIEQVESSSQS